MDKATVRDIDVRGKRVLERVDFNVPLDGAGHITDDTRIRASLPTIQYVRDHGAALVLMSHLGRPKGKVDAAYSLRPVAERLGELLGRPVQIAPDCVGPEVERMAQALQPREVLLLENLRLHGEDVVGAADFAQHGAERSDSYVNGACGTAVDAQARKEGV